MYIKLDENRNIEWNNCTCPICGKTFHLKPSAVKQHKTIHNKLNPNKRDKLGRFTKYAEPKTIKAKRVTKTAILPKKQSIGAAGYDLYADTGDQIIVKPHETVMIQSNIAF